MTIFAALAAGWVALLLFGPFLPAPIAGVLYLFGGRICHQIAERSFHLDGAQLPVCARCLGIYIGAALVWVPAVGARHWKGLLLGAFLLNAATIAAEWVDIWSVTNTIRAAAGAALGVAMALTIRHALGAPAPTSGTVDYERCPLPRRTPSALPESHT